MAGVPFFHFLFYILIWILSPFSRSLDCLDSRRKKSEVATWRSGQTNTIAYNKTINGLARLVEDSPLYPSTPSHRKDTT